MDFPSLSIITPTLNQARFIEETIDSVLAQAYPKLEYIVMDGGSSDGTLAILKRHERHLTWFSQKDRGQSDALNKGFRMAKGEVLAYLNSDDIYEPGALLKVGAFFARHPQAHWVTGKCRIIDPQGKEIRRPITAYKNFWLRLRSYTVLQILDYISQPATFWRREVIERVGLFDENLKYAMDYDYSLRVGKRYQLWFINQYLASFRIHPTSKAGASADAQFIADLEILKSHTSAQWIIWLHKLHNCLIIPVYRLLMNLF